MTSIKDMRVFVDGVAEEWVEWNQEYPSEGQSIQKSDVVSEVKLGPGEWGFEVWIHPGTMWTQAPIYIEFSSGEKSLTTLTLPLRDPMRNEDADLLTYPEHNEFAADLLLTLQEIAVTYTLEIVTREWIQQKLELPDDTYPYALKAQLATSDFGGLRQEMFEMASTVQYIASNY
jgi:hypothetical protein